MLDQLKKLILQNDKNKKILITVGWVSLVLLILIIAATTGNTGTLESGETVQSQEFNIGEMVFGTFIRLLLVLALIYGIFSLYRLFQKGEILAAKRRILLMDTFRFSPKQAIAILSVDGEEILIGLTDHQIVLLKTLDHDNEPADILDNGQTLVNKPFQDYMDERK